VHVHPLDAAVGGHVNERQQVVDVAVHAPIRDQPQQVQRRAAGPLAGVDQDRVLPKRPRSDVVLDAHQILADDPAGAEVGVADLGVPLLALRQADRPPGGIQGAVRVLLPEPVEDRRAGQPDGVSRAFLGKPPTVQDDQADQPLAQPAAACRMAANSSTSRLAPPIRPPSTSGWTSRPAAFSGFIEPPYWMRTASAAWSPWSSRIRPRMKACASWASSGVAVRPVPIAHTGS